MKTIEDYERIETTTGMNGYPQALRFAYTGFETADELNEFAEAHPEGRIISIHKRDGWSLWERKSVGWAEDFILTADTYGDDYYTFASIQEIEQEIESLKGELDDDSDILTNLEKLKSVFNKYCATGNKQILTTYGYDDWEIIPIRTLGYCYDTHHYGYAFMMEDC